MKKLSILTLLLMMATFVFANNNEPETTNTINEEIMKTTAKPEEGPTIIIYGDRAGIFRPCTNSSNAVCKKIIFSQTERGMATITDGITTIVININQVNLEDGSVYGM